MKLTGSRLCNSGRGKFFCHVSQNILPVINQSEGRNRFRGCFRNSLCRVNFVGLYVFGLVSLVRLQTALKMSENGFGHSELIHLELKNGMYIFRLCVEAKNLRHF